MKSPAERKVTEYGAEMRSLVMKLSSFAASISENDDVSDEGSTHKMRKPRISNYMSLDDNLSGQIQESVHLKCVIRSEASRLEERKIAVEKRLEIEMKKQKDDQEEKCALLNLLREMAVNLNNAGKKMTGSV